MKSILLATSVFLFFATAHAADKKKPLPTFPTHTDPKAESLIENQPTTTKNKRNDAPKNGPTCKNANGVKLFENDPGYESCVYEKNKRLHEAEDTESPTRN